MSKKKEAINSHEKEVIGRIKATNLIKEAHRDGGVPTEEFFPEGWAIPTPRQPRPDRTPEQESAHFRELLEKAALYRYASIGLARSEQMSDFASKGTKEKKYPEETRKRWREKAAAMPTHLSCNGKAKLIAKQEGLPEKAIQSIRKEIASLGK